MNSPPASARTLPGHLRQVVSRLQPIGRLEANARLGLAIGLPLRDRAGLTNLLDQLYDPASPNYRHFLTTEEFTRRFGPTGEDYEKVKSFARLHGLTVTATHPNRLLLDVEGSVADVEKAFQVTLRTFRHPTEQRDFRAPDTDPQAPEDVPIWDVSGLDDYELPRPAGWHGGALKDLVSSASMGSGPAGTFMAADLRAAYVPGVPLNGAGQKVGLLQFDAYYPSDVLAYEKLNAISPPVPVKRVLLPPATGDPGPVSDETTADIELAIAMAPGLSQVIVYEATPNSNGNDMLNRMANDNAARQLSSSWFFPTDQTSDDIFLQMAAQGQAFFEASGDAGAYVWQELQLHEGHPADNPLVTSVGGTLLSAARPGGAWMSETSWRDPRDSTILTGGGVSGIYTMPTYQKGVDMSVNGGSADLRNFPDVSINAQNMFFVWNKGEEGYLDGTSAGAPLWAGLAALVNQRAAQTGQPPIGFFNPAIYALAESSNYNSAFHDITDGDNTTADSPYFYYAAPGFDLCTGWGSPRGANLIAGLLSLRIRPTVTIVNPQPNTRVTNATVTVTGTASGPSPIIDVEVQIDTNDWVDATTTNNWLDWSVPDLPLPTGLVTLHAAALDANGVFSPVAQVEFPCTPVSFLTMSVNPPGLGSLKPAFSGSYLQIGRVYSITAVAASNNVFSNWTGTIISNANPLTFFMQPGMVLQANFSTNLCVGAAGTYNGLFGVANSLAPETSGKISGLLLRKTRAYSGQLWIQGGPYSLTGSFDLSGNSQAVARRTAAAGGNLTVNMNLLWNDPVPSITGSVSGGNILPWTADLALKLDAVSNPGAALRYNMSLAPVNGDPAFPTGDGDAFITLSGSMATLIGSLADGAPLNQTAALSLSGDFPVYASLYNKGGFLWGWLNLQNPGATGNLTWFKYAAPGAALYPRGFSLSLNAVGHSWIAPAAGAAAVALTNATLTVNGGALAAPLQYTVSIGAGNKLVITGPGSGGPFKGSIDPKTGKLTVSLGAGKSAIAAHGVVMQDTAIGSGFFVGKTNAGSLNLNP